MVLVYNNNMDTHKYLDGIRERGKKSRISTKHQLVGLRISEELDDPKHKALYMKLAKQGNSTRLEWLAADVADRKNLRKPGAYFMATLMKTEKEANEWLKHSAKPVKKITEAKKHRNAKLFR